MDRTKLDCSKNALTLTHTPAYTVIQFQGPIQPSPLPPPPPPPPNIHDIAIMYVPIHACSIIYTDEHAPGPCTVDITALFKEFTTTSLVEATPDFLEIPHAGGTTLKCEEGSSKECEEKINNFLIELYPLQLKTLILTLS